MERGNIVAVEERPGALTDETGWISQSSEEPEVNERDGDRTNDGGLVDLPDACIGLIVMRLSPRDVARGECVCRGFRNTFQSDLVWEHLLPDSYPEILALACDVPQSFSSKRDVFEFFTRQVLLRNGTQACWLDKATGAVCYSVSARGLNVVWGDDDRYWRWLPRKGSSWPEVASLKEVCWFEATGELNCLLPQGSYTLSFRLQLSDRKDSRDGDHVYGWASSPTEFSLSLSDGTQASSNHRFLSNRFENARLQNQLQNITPVRVVEDDWMEYDVGEFVVEEKRKSVTLRFSMIEIESGHWKSGVNLDGVVVRPTSLTNTIGYKPTVAELGESATRTEDWRVTMDVEGFLRGRRFAPRPLRHRLRDANGRT